MIEVDGVRGSGGIGRYFDFFNDERPRAGAGNPGGSHMVSPEHDIPSCPANGHD